MLAGLCFIDMSESLMDYFIDAEVLYHPGGHGIPLRAAQKKTFNNFFTECKGLCFLTGTNQCS